MWVNEYTYKPYRMEGGGSIDFVGIDPKDGQVYIIECKLNVNNLEDLEDQLYRYYHAYGVNNAIKEVYCFGIDDDKKAWLEARKINVYILSMGDDPAPLSTSHEDWEYFKVIHDYWHYGYMLPRARYREDIYSSKDQWKYSEYRRGLFVYYRKWREDHNVPHNPAWESTN